MPATSQTYASETFTTSTQTLNAPLTSVTVQHDAYVVPTGNNKAFSLGTGVWTFTLDGVIDGQGDGIDLADRSVAKNSKLTVGAEGSLGALGNGAIALNAQQVVDVANSGDIFGGNTAIFMNGNASGSKGFAITNNAGATIVGGVIGIYDNISGVTMTLKNAGEIAGHGAIAVAFAGAVKITNTGLVTGDLATTNSANLFDNAVSNSGRIAGGVTLDSGDDMVKNTGTITGAVNLFAGDNSLVNSGTIGGAVNGGDGHNTVTNTGHMLSTLSLGDGGNKVTSSGEIAGDVTLGKGDDVFKNSGTIDGATLDLGEGKNSFTNSGHILVVVTSGSGNDTIVNSGTILSSIGLSAGADTLTNSGLIEFGGDLGGDNDTLKNTGTIHGTLNLGEGDNTATNSGSIGTLKGGSGNDTVTSTGTIGTVDLGAGDDSFTGGNAHDQVNDNSGTDTYKLGGGDDLFLSFGKGSFTLDGGTGQDRFDASQVTSEGYKVNLGTTDAEIFITTFNAGTAFTATGHVGGSIKNFEDVDGTVKADTLIGSAGANVLNGFDDDDTIAGGLGADTLSGGNGTDNFYYFSTKDSGTTKATWDTITDFTPGTDKIDLIAIDANTKTANVVEHFAFIGYNTAFTQVGQLRALTVGQDTILQGDTNGDGKADFAIDLVGVAFNAFTGGDIV